MLSHSLALQPEQFIIVEGRLEMSQMAALLLALLALDLAEIGSPESLAGLMEHLPNRVRGDAHLLRDQSIAQALQLTQEENTPLPFGQTTDGLQNPLANVILLQAGLLGFFIPCHASNPPSRKPGRPKAQQRESSQSYSARTSLSDGDCHCRRGGETLRQHGYHQENYRARRSHSWCP